MSYQVNAAGSDGAISVPVASLSEALAKVEELKADGYTNIVLVDAETGVPVRKGEAREARGKLAVGAIAGSRSRGPHCVLTPAFALDDKGTDWNDFAASAAGRPPHARPGRT